MEEVKLEDKDESNIEEEEILLLPHQSESEPDLKLKIIGFSIMILLIIVTIGLCVWVLICAPFNGMINNSTNYTNNLCF